MKSTFVLTNKVEDLNGDGYLTGREENSPTIHPNNVPNNAMMQKFFRNCEDLGLCCTPDYGF